MLALREISAIFEKITNIRNSYATKLYTLNFS